MARGGILNVQYPKENLVDVERVSDVALVDNRPNLLGALANVVIDKIHIEGRRVDMVAVG